MLGVAVVSLTFIGFLAGAAVAAWVGWLLLGRARRGRFARIAALSLAVMLSLTTGADAVNRHYAYLPRVGDVLGVSTWPLVPTRALRLVETARATSAKRWPGGGVIKLAVRDTYSSFGRHRALVDLPPQYFTEPTRRFPVVYLLHGSPGVPVDWLRGGRAAQAGRVAARAGFPVIIVMPRVTRSWMDDTECVNGRKGAAETYVVRDVVNAVDWSLRTLADRTHRAIGGMSAGGFCALNLGLRHPDVYSVILDMSGYTRPTYTGGARRLFEPISTAAAEVRANSPADYVTRMPTRPSVAIWLDYGARDHSVAAEMVPFARALRRRGIAPEFHVRPGSHTFAVWVPALRESLLWAARRLSQS